MPVYVLMTRLGPKVMGDPRGRKAVSKEWKKRVKELCPDVKWIAHYALLGPYDFMDIYEAPNEEAAVAVSHLSRTSGALIAESWPAMPYDRYLEISNSVEAIIKDEDD